MQGSVQAAGRVSMKLLKNDQKQKMHRVMLGEIIRDGFPHRGLPAEVNRWRLRNCRSLIVPAIKIAVLNRLKAQTIVPTLRLVLMRGDGTRLDYGLASLKLVTDVGVAYIVDAFQNSVEVENMKFHGFGTGTTNESASDTALVTELTTEYAVNSTRPTGSTTEGASANIYRTVGTLTPDSGGTLAITEQGVFSASSAGVLLDRSKFAAVNVVASADSLQATYELTFPSGG